AVREQVVESRRVAAQEDAEEGGDTHRREHVPGRVLGALEGRRLALVRAKPDEVGDLETIAIEGADRREIEEEGGPEEVAVETGLDDHRLADESAEQREGGDREAAD